VVSSWFFLILNDYLLTSYEDQTQGLYQPRQPGSHGLSVNS